MSAQKGKDPLNELLHLFPWMDPGHPTHSAFGGDGTLAQVAIYLLLNYPKEYKGKRMPEAPTDAVPGSVEKVFVLAARFAARESLFHAGDAAS